MQRHEAERVTEARRDGPAPDTAAELSVGKQADRSSSLTVSLAQRLQADMSNGSPSASIIAPKGCAVSRLSRSDDRPMSGLGTAPVLPP
ncbi:hypothetical protein [Palleronia rufa]|uniref:hypothetical protein n=1 Tax=Palleronia rufa TaxID=1530186 RepID=UPI0012694F4D